MTKAFVDTTILANVLLKDGSSKEAALAALARYDSTEMPVYAIKEFKAGPLSYWVWLHNRLKAGGSFADGLTGIRKLHPLKAHHKATALEALEWASQQQKGVSVSDWGQKYGPKADTDNIMADRARYSLRRRITNAWARRRKITGAVVLPL